MELEPQGKAITSKYLAGRLGIEKGYVQRLVSDTQKISENYINVRRHTPPERKGKRGAPLVSYHLNHQKFVTRKDTAFILLVLLEYPLKYPPEEMFRIERNEFVEYLTTEHRLDEGIVQERIEWGIDNFYITASEDRTRIYYGDKVLCERDYLLLLKQELPSQP
jgi:hypothetical protein